MNTLEAEGIEFLAGNGAGPGLRLKTLGVSRENFLTFLKLYERNRLGAKARYATPLPHFGYTFAFRSDGADLLFHGQLLGSVRWNEGMVIFDPPLPPPGQDEPLSDQAFDIWVSRAEYRNATGI